MASFPRTLGRPKTKKSRDGKRLVGQFHSEALHLESKNTETKGLRMQPVDIAGFGPLAVEKLEVDKPNFCRHCCDTVRDGFWRSSRKKRIIVMMFVIAGFAAGGIAMAYFAKDAVELLVVDAEKSEDDSHLRCKVTLKHKRWSRVVDTVPASLLRESSLRDAKADIGETINMDAGWFETFVPAEDDDAEDSIDWKTSAAPEYKRGWFGSWFGGTTEDESATTKPETKEQGLRNGYAEIVKTYCDQIIYIKGNLMTLSIVARERGDEKKTKVIIKDMTYDIEMEDVVKWTRSFMKWGASDKIFVKNEVFSTEREVFEGNPTRVDVTKWDGFLGLLRLTRLGRLDVIRMSNESSYY